MIPNLQWALY